MSLFLVMFWEFMEAEKLKLRASFIHYPSSTPTASRRQAIRGFQEHLYWFNVTMTPTVDTHCLMETGSMTDGMTHLATHLTEADAKCNDKECEKVHLKCPLKAGEKVSVLLLAAGQALLPTFLKREARPSASVALLW